MRGSSRGAFAAFKVLIGLLRPYRGQFVVSLAALALGSSINLVFPEVVRRALDEQGFPWAKEHVGLITAGLAALFVLQGAAFYARSRLFGSIGQRVFCDVREIGRAHV